MTDEAVNLAQIKKASGMQVARKVVIVLVVILLLDFLLRLTWSVDVAGNQDANANGLLALKDKSSIMTVEKVEKLFAWSDIEPKAPEVTQPVVTEVKQPEVVKPKEPTPEEVRQQVVQSISGDVTKTLLGDDLLTLKGLFYDGKDFAVIEVENIYTKQKQYKRASVGEKIGDYLLEGVSNTSATVAYQQQKVTLKMFK